MYYYYYYFSIEISAIFNALMIISLSLKVIK